MFQSKITNLLVTFQKNVLVFSYKYSAVPGTVTYVLHLSVRYTQLIRSDHNYESYKCRIWVLLMYSTRFIFIIV